MILEAAHVRKEYDDASSKLSKIQSRITSLTDKLKQDFGKLIDTLSPWWLSASPTCIFCSY